MIGLTPTQQETLDFIRSFIEVNQFPPTRAEISIEFGVFPNAIQDRLNWLATKGAIEIVPGTARGIRVLEN